jgi:signal transduction histidine kinase/CheY-like chemotaxis protein
VHPPAADSDANRTTPRPADQAAELRLAHRLLDERCRYQAKQILLEPVLILSLSVLAGSGLSDLVPPATLTGWVMLSILAASARLLLALSLLRRRFCRDARPHAALFRISTGLTGLLLGSSACLFFPHIGHDARLLITLALAGWLAAALPLHAAFPRHARLHLVLVIGQLAVAWWLSEPEHGALWALGLSACALLLDRLSRTLSHTLGTAQRGRHQRRELLRRLAVETRQAQAASASASRFLAAASHDLRQPATALSLMSGLLSERCPDPKLRPLTDGIVRSSVALNDLLGNLLDLSRLDAGVTRAEPQWHELASVLDDLKLEFEQRIQSKGLSFGVEPLTGEVFTDRILLMRMVRNLLENALRYTDQGGISILARAGSRLEIIVSDTGIGMPEELRDSISRPMESLADTALRSRRNGLGIGLAMVRRIALLLRADLDIQSDGRTWSRVSILMPVASWREGVSTDQESLTLGTAACATTQGGRVGTRPVKGGQAQRALLVEDSPEVARAMTAILESRGYRVDCAHTAEDAIRLMRSAIRFILIISDLRLGGEMDGADLLVRARLLQPGSRCILTTADTSAYATGRARQAGLELLHKPLRTELLA